jgi:hypothetical protein
MNDPLDLLTVFSFVYSNAPSQRRTIICTCLSLLCFCNMQYHLLSLILSDLFEYYRELEQLAVKGEVQGCRVESSRPLPPPKARCE